MNQDAQNYQNCCLNIIAPNQELDDCHFIDNKPSTYSTSSSTNFNISPTHNSHEGSANTSLQSFPYALSRSASKIHQLQDFYCSEHLKPSQWRTGFYPETPPPLTDLSSESQHIHSYQDSAPTFDYKEKTFPNSRQEAALLLIANPNYIPAPPLTSTRNNILPEFQARIKSSKSSHRKFFSKTAPIRRELNCTTAI